MGYNYREMNVVIKKENFTQAEALLRKANLQELEDETLQGVDFLIQATSTYLCTSKIGVDGDLVFETSGSDEKYSFDYWQEPLAPVIEDNSYIEVAETFNDTIYRIIFYQGKSYRGIMPVWPTGEQLANDNSVEDREDRSALFGKTEGDDVYRFEENFGNPDPEHLW